MVCGLAGHAGVKGVVVDLEKCPTRSRKLPPRIIFLLHQRKRNGTIGPIQVSFVPGYTQLGPTPTSVKYPYSVPLHTYVDSVATRLVIQFF
jgi:hypothetical protein